jgi:hypothetical protein
MSEYLSPEELAQLEPAEKSAFASPIPTQVISNGEFMPSPQGASQRCVEARIKDLADELGKKQGMSRRRFLKTLSGMAAAFVAMNEIYGYLFEVDMAEAAIPEKAVERAKRLAHQFVFDDHTHFMRPDAAADSPLRRFVRLRELAGKTGLNPALAKEPQTFQHLQFDNYVKEMFLDSDTKMAILSGAPSDIPKDWFLTNEMKAEARARVNKVSGSRRLMYQAVFTPGQPGWLEDIDRAIGELKPDSWKGYTIGDNTHRDTSKYPWRMDDERMTYKGYEKMLKAGIRNVCVHKGLFPPSAAKQHPWLEQYAKVDDVGKAAKDWPDLNFLIYHAGYRYVGGGRPEEAEAEFARSGRIAWVTDLAEIPEKFGVDNVYADVGSTFGSTCVTHPRLAAALMGALIKGLGADHVVWGTDSVWNGSPQWQIEALRRLEIPEEMQKKHGFAPLGPADGLVKSAILGYNSARLYNLELKATLRELENDGLAKLKAEYESAGTDRSNLAYGYILKRSRDRAAG